MMEVSPLQVDEVKKGQAAQGFLNEFDLNRDGQLDFEEFQEASLLAGEMREHGEL